MCLSQGAPFECMAFPSDRKKLSKLREATKGDGRLSYLSDRNKITQLRVPTELFAGIGH